MKTYFPQKKILIIKFGGLGDMILSLGAISSIYNHHKCRMVLLTEEPFDKFLNKSNWFSEIVTIKRNIFYFLDIRQIREKINCSDFDFVYDLQTSNRTANYLKLFLNTKAITNGIGKFAKIIHIHKNRNLMHTLDRQKDQIKLSQIKYKYKNFKWLFESKFNIPKRKYVMIVPGGSWKRKNKRIPQEIYLKVINFLIKAGLEILIMGSKDDEKICREIEKNFPTVKNLCDKTDLFDLGKLSKNSFLSIGNDTGPMHLIAKGGNDVLVLFTKFSNPDLCKPIGKKVSILTYENDKVKLLNEIILKLKKKIKFVNED